MLITNLVQVSYARLQYQNTIDLSSITVGLRDCMMPSLTPYDPRPHCDRRFCAVL